MPCLSAQQLRALSAAAGVVGRPHLRAGLLLTLAVACGPVPDDAADESTSDDPASTSGSTSASTGPGPITTTTADDSHDTGGSAGGTATASDDLTTSGGTLLTEVMTTGDTGDLTTGDTSSGSDTGELGECIDPATMEVDWACCEAQNWEPSPQCTPWGPPAPPALSRDLLARARAARLELA